MLVLIIGYNRPHYYKKCIEAVKKNTGCKVIVSVDQGGVTQEYKDLTPSTYEFIEHNNKLGIGHHLFLMRDYAFSKDDRVLIIEDDVVINGNFFKTAKLLDQWSNTYANIGATSLWNHCLLPDIKKKLYKNIIIANNTNWITYCMKRECWQDIRPIIKEYLDKFVPLGAYEKRKHGEIREWARKTFTIPSQPRQPALTFEGMFHAPNLFSGPKFPSSQDAMMAGAMHNTGWIKINTLVNRCKYIGAEGEHGTRALYERDKFGEMTLNTYLENGKFHINGQPYNATKGE